MMGQLRRIRVLIRATVDWSRQYISLDASWETHRLTLGGEWAVASCIVTELGKVPKCRGRR